MARTFQTDWYTCVSEDAIGLENLIPFYWLLSKAMPGCSLRLYFHALKVDHAAIWCTRDILHVEEKHFANIALKSDRSSHGLSSVEY